MSALTAFSTQLASFYSEDRKVVETLSCLIFIIGLLKLVDDPSLSMQAAIEACQKTKEIMITRATGCILGAFAAFFSSFWIGPIGIWIGVGALISWSLLVYAIRVRIHFWP
jgi:Na+-driven multidrug efflux pump